MNNKNPNKYGKWVKILAKDRTYAGFVYEYYCNKCLHTSYFIPEHEGKYCPWCRRKMSIENKKGIK